MSFGLLTALDSVDVHLAAVDEGVIRASGDLKWMANTGPRHNGAFLVVQFRLICDDGSGTIVLGDEVLRGQDQDPEDSRQIGMWFVISGTGGCESLTGGGGYWGFWMPDPVSEQPPPSPFCCSVPEGWGHQEGRLTLTQP